MSVNTVQFVIWGIRDGFKNNLMSNGPVAPFVSHLTDQRQLWNKFKNRFYSITRASGQTLITIYDPTVLDILGRDTGSTIAISLIVPRGYSLSGDPMYTLRHLMDYYVSKQNETTSFGFTQSMFEEEIVGIELAAQPGASSAQISLGKKGFIQFQDESSILSYFQHLDIGPYEHVLFFSDDFHGQYPEILVHQFGSHPISSFQPPVHVTLVGYLASRYEIRVSGKKLTVSTSGELDALPGEVLEITALTSGQTKRLTVGTSSQAIWLEQEFPRRPQGPPPPPPFNWKKILIPAFGLLLLGVIGYEIYDFTKPPPPPVVINNPTPDPNKGNEPVVNNPNPPAPKWEKETILFSSIDKNLSRLKSKQEKEIKDFAVNDTVKISFIEGGIVLDFLDVDKKNKVREKIVGYLTPKKPDQETSKKPDPQKTTATNQQNNGSGSNKALCARLEKEIRDLTEEIENKPLSASEKKEKIKERKDKIAEKRGNKCN